ncbi:acetate--CoA ligase family protein [Citricoccus sp. NR2]|uniref:acetate--CoA ligase family protein n=1 Tax=Citricoccus sp. NR2 TaxID=3004095 RepID=UPI0022DD1F61|nr:acetate--CoA ligase family protein [Citricoccus sp. NR2]WBL19566.1 acetate--CoA ligase family protein [Citricoccus sp. NR2]
MTTSPALTATDTGLNRLFEPRGIAVIGASAEPDKLGAVMAAATSEYEHPVALVNPRNPEMYASIDQAAQGVDGLDKTIDLAILCVPAAVTAEVLRSTAQAGVGAALVCAGGFAEAGGPGIAYQQQIIDVIEDTGIRVLGPNTSGFFIPRRKLIASFVPGAAHLKSGVIGVVSSSGGVNHSLSFRLDQAGVGVSLGVGIGAGIDVTAAEVIDYLADDPATEAIALHIETVPDGRRLMAAVRRASVRKPVIALVVGENDVAEFAQSHTGALATSWKSTCAALLQSGAVLVRDESELVAAAAALSRTRIGAQPVPGVGLITGQAGPGLIAADHLSGARVNIPPLADSTVASLTTLLPPLTFQGNPVDTGRPAGTFSDVINTVANDASIDAVGIYGLLEPVADFVQAVKNAKADHVATVLSVDGPSDDVRRVVRDAAAAGIPVVSGPTALAQSLEALVRDAVAQHNLLQSEQSSKSIAVGDGPWDEATSKDLLQEAGVNVPARFRASTHAEAQAALGQLAGPTAVKLVDAEILHKTDIGGVHLGVSTESQLEAALLALDKAGAKEYLIEEMASDGIDLVVGARRDPVFGVVVLLGIGGTAVEVMGDVAVGIHPLREGAVDAMIDDLATGPILRGWRGGPAVDADALAQILSILGQTLEDNSDLSEFEINPLRMTNAGLVALDAVIVAAPTQNEEERKG